MSNIGIPVQNLLESIGNNTGEISISKKAPKINTKVPKHLQEQVQYLLEKNNGEKEKLLKESRDKKNLELKIEQIFIALEKKYPDFERNNYTIKDAMLGDKYDVYCLFSKKGNLLSYINSKGEIILDMKNFKPFKDGIDKSFKNSVGIDYIKRNDGKWYLLLTNDKGKIIEHIEGSERFNMAVTPD